MPRMSSSLLFSLGCCELPQFAGSNRLQQIVGTTLTFNNNWKLQPDIPGPPVLLRWVTHPSIGFPLGPFELYRCRRSEQRGEGLAAGRFRGPAIIGWGNREIYRVTFQYQATEGILTVNALDRGNQPIPGQRLRLSGTGVASLTAPGTVGLSIVGDGTVSDVRGVAMEDHVNLSEWQLIERVGLPMRRGQGNPLHYDSRARQGVEPANLDGYEAALMRLTVASMLHREPPLTGVRTIPTPPWPAPDPRRFRDYLCDRSPSPLELILRCLNNSDNLVPGRLQARFIDEAATPGPRQLGRSEPPAGAPLRETRLGLPVLPVTLLSVASDGYAATGLGYGSLDLPEELRPSSLANYDYMVVGVFQTMWGKLELAAPHAVQPPPSMPQDLEVRRRDVRRPGEGEPISEAPGRHFINRPERRDGPISEALELSWELSREIQGYVVGVSRRNGAVDLLNEAHDRGWFSAFMPQRPPPWDGNPPVDVRANFVDTAAPVPFTGSIRSEYIVAGLDVFGRWSPWQRVSHSPALPPVQKPGVHTVRFTPAGEPEADGTVPFTIEIELSWNEEDRSLHAVDLTGHFFALTPPATPGPAPTGFQLRDGSPATQPLRVLLDVSGAPRLPAGSPFSATVTSVAPNPPERNPPDPNLLKYLVQVHGAGHRFAGVTSVGYAVYAVARERVREPNPNSDEAVSTPSAPAEQPTVATVVDPRPPATPVLIPDLRWTALPDATGRARGVLRWLPSARATGYAVWQATESAIRLAVDVGQPEPLPGTSLMERAAALQALLNRDEAARRDCLRAFARLNTNLVTATELEIELPGAANTLYAYRISAVGANNEMSERSGGAILFGVPRRNVPGRPWLMLRKGPAGVFAICLEAPGAAVAGFQLFRVREASLLIDAGAVGEPRFGAADAGWQPLDALPPDPTWDVVRQVAATLPAGTRGRAILDTAPASWRPYWYAAVALGAENLAAGEYAGESPRSAAQRVVLAPAGAPALTPPILSVQPDSRVLEFAADLPVRRTDLGIARIAIYRLDTGGERARREPLIEAHADEVPEGDLPAGPFAETTIRRGPPGAGGLTRYLTLLPPGVTAGAVVVTDPLGRAIERTFTEAPA